MLHHSQQSTPLRSQQFKSAATQLDQQRTWLQLANNSSNIFVIKMIISNLIAQSASHLAASSNQGNPLSPRCESSSRLQSTAQPMKFNMPHSEFEILSISRTHTLTNVHTNIKACICVRFIVSYYSSAPASGHAKCLK